MRIKTKRKKNRRGKQKNKKRESSSKIREGSNREMRDEEERWKTRTSREKNCMNFISPKHNKRALYIIGSLEKVESLETNGTLSLIEDKTFFQLYSSFMLSSFSCEIMLSYI